MCGIVGYVGKPKSAKQIIKILSMLEYRGYDSAGISAIMGTEVHIVKEVGAIDVLRRKIPDNWQATNAIAHTRWATHGASSVENAHPHQSANKEWIIVHNGIIDNYRDLKASLKHMPVGQTDTEVLVEYIAENNVKTFDDFVALFKNIKGSYALICQNAKRPDELYIAKKNSPIYLATDADNNIYLASDPMCFAKFTNNYKVFNDNEFAYIKDQKVFIVDSESRPVIKESMKLNDEVVESTKLTYDHYMQKEIFEQPDALRRQVDFYKTQKILERLDAEFLKQFDYVKFIGCGTAYHACLVGAKYIQSIVGIPTSAEISSEFIYNTNVLNHRRTLCVFISQSGETADTINALNIEKQKQAVCVVLTNVAYSTLAQKADYVLPLCAGPEISVASTKAYTCQLSVLYLFANALKDASKLDECYEKLTTLSNQVLNFDTKKADEIASFLVNKKDAVFIGKDFDFITAREGALKIKEVTYINANSAPAGELKHGYLAIIEEGMPLFVIATDQRLKEKIFNSASEAVARGAKKIVISTEDIECEYAIRIANADPLLMPILAIVPIQYIAYKTSILKGINPDKPRNLAKSVTVE